jgi:hypothetical protein
LAGQRAERMGHETLRGSRPDEIQRDYKRDIRSVQRTRALLRIITHAPALARRSISVI